MKWGREERSIEKVKNHRMVINCSVNQLPFKVRYFDKGEQDGRNANEK